MTKLIGISLFKVIINLTNLEEKLGDFEVIHGYDYL